MQTRLCSPLEILSCLLLFPNVQDCAVSSVLVFHTNPSAPIGLLMAKDLDTGEYTRVDNLHFDSVERLSKARKTRGHGSKK